MNHEMVEKIVKNTVIKPSRFDKIQALESRLKDALKQVHVAKIDYMNGNKLAGKSVLWSVYGVWNSKEYTELENDYKQE